MKLTVIISYYKAIDNLKVILNALNHQSCKNFEVIISEDDFNEETIQFIKKFKDSYCFPITHLNQKVDNGFRKNSMLNQSVIQSKSDLLAFIDGDCFPHKHFVKEYIKNMDTEHFFAGRAVMLDEETSNKILKAKKLISINFFTILFSKSKHIKDGIYFPFFPLVINTKGLVGRNWGVHKINLTNINGFDEDYILPGVGEDVDIEWRLLESGIKRKTIKNKAIVYHLYHPRVYAESDVKKNYKLLAEKKITNNIICSNGINLYNLNS